MVATAAQRRPFSSPRALLLIGNFKIGWVTGFRIRPSATGAPIKVFGDMYRQRTEPVDADGSGSFDLIHILSEPLSAARQDGFVLWADHLLSTGQWIDYEPPNLTLVDAKSKRVICTVEGMFPENQEFALVQGGLLQHSGSFSFRKAYPHATPVL